MKKNLHRGARVLAFALFTSFGSAAVAAVTFDGLSGMGFVGKGDVQYTFGWNNKIVQDNADSVQFQAVSEVVTEVSWICTNANNQNIQERERTTTTTVAGLVNSVARLKNQITGFNLLGYDGDPVETSDTEGPSVNSCPSGPWSLTTPAGDPEVVNVDTYLEVSPDDGDTWEELVEKPLQ